MSNWRERDKVGVSLSVAYFVWFICTVAGFGLGFVVGHGKF